MSKFCKYCGTAIGDGMKFCKSCGQPVTVQPAYQQQVTPPKKGSGKMGMVG